MNVIIVGYLREKKMLVYTIINDNIISTNQILYLEIYGNQINGDMFNNEIFDYDRDTHSIIGILYAGI